MAIPYRNDSVIVILLYPLRAKVRQAGRVPRTLFCPLTVFPGEVWTGLWKRLLALLALLSPRQEKGELGKQTGTWREEARETLSGELK